MINVTRRWIYSLLIVALATAISACSPERSQATNDALMSGDPDTFRAVIHDHLVEALGDVESVQVSYDEPWASTFQQRIVFYTFDQVVNERSQPGFGYAIVAHQGGNRWAVAHNRHTILDDPPSLVAYDGEQYEGILIIYGRVFARNVAGARLVFDTTKQARAQCPPCPPGNSFAAIEPYASALREVRLLEIDTEREFMTYNKARLLSRSDE